MATTITRWKITFAKIFFTLILVALLQRACAIDVTQSRSEKNGSQAFRNAHMLFTPTRKLSNCYLRNNLNVCLALSSQDLSLTAAFCLNHSSQVDDDVQPAGSVST